MKRIAVSVLAIFLASCASWQPPQSAQPLPSRDRSLPRWGESEAHFEDRMGDHHAQRPDGTSFPRDYRMTVAGETANVHPIFASLPGGKTTLQSSMVNTGRTGNPLSAAVKRAFLTAMLPRDAKRIPATGNGPVVLKDSEAHEGEVNVFYESVSFAKSVPKKASCRDIRPGILLIYTEGDHGAGPSSVQVFSEYLATCFTSTPMRQT